MELARGAGSFPSTPGGINGLEAHPVGSYFSLAARCQVPTRPAHGIGHLQASDVVLKSRLGPGQHRCCWRSGAGGLCPRILHMVFEWEKNVYTPQCLLSSNMAPASAPRRPPTLCKEACYLCHSLLTLAGVVVSCQDITPDQWGELQLLCMQLDRHINTHIRESPQAMHQTTLKDLAAQTYIRWQELLAHCQPQAQYFSLWEGV